MNNLESEDKIILVSGGAGYIGSHMVNLLLRNGFKVISIDNLANCYAPEPHINFIKANIGDTKTIKNILTNNKIYAVFHFAALIEAGQSMINPGLYYQNNVADTINFIDVVVKNSPESHFIFSSSAAIYEPKDHLIKEENKKKPSNIYGKTKLMIEEILHDYGTVHNLSYGILRYFNACGADYKNGLGENRKIETHLIPLLLQSLNRKDADFSIYGNDYATNDGTCVRDYIHVKDICDAHLKLLRHLESRQEQKCFNIGTGQGHSILEIIKKTEELTHKEIKIHYKPRRSGDSSHLVADPKLANSLLNWSPKFSSIETIISSAWHWEKLCSNRILSHNDK